jgi:ribosomal protein S12 methylthiotransferase accessory factor YcaO
MLWSGVEIWLAAQLVYIPYERSSDAVTTDLQSSVGLAAGRSLEEAVRHGPAEIIERDVSVRLGINACEWKGFLLNPTPSRGST